MKCLIYPNSQTFSTATVATIADTNVPRNYRVIDKDIAFVYGASVLNT